MVNKYDDFKNTIKKINEDFGSIGDISLMHHILSTIEDDYKATVTDNIFEYVRKSVRDEIVYDYESSFHNILKDTVEYFELDSKI